MLDLAEHTPGTPFHYKHGWVPISGIDWVNKSKPSKEHVLDIWHKANPDEIEAGKDWYDTAHMLSHALAKETGLSDKQAAGLIAVYSPQTAWANNLINAARVMKNHKGIGGKGGGVLATDRQRKAADRILAGEDYEKVLKGKKILAFARLIEDPSHNDAVIDRHAMSVAAGSRAPGDVTSPKSISGYKKWSKAYQDAAAELGLRPHQVQAATWLAQQRMNQELDLTTMKSSPVASNAATAWEAYEEFIHANFPGLKVDIPETGYELAEPQPEPQQPTATIKAPPNQDQTIQHVAEILLAGLAIEQTVAAIAAVINAPVEIVRETLQQTGGLSGHKAHARLMSLAIEPKSDGAKVARSAAKQEIFYRAGYLVNAIERVEADVKSGESIEEALAGEKKIFRSHEVARRGRLDAAAGAGAAANIYGDLLGWYVDPNLENEIECLTANGHNFSASEGTLIGYPSGVHPHCGCLAGPPIWGAGMVNDALREAGQVIFEQPRKYQLRRSA